MKKYTLKELKLLFKEYSSTLGTYEEEMYVDERTAWTCMSEDFIEWLEGQK